MFVGLWPVASRRSLPIYVPPRVPECLFPVHIRFRRISALSALVLQVLRSLLSYLWLFSPQELDIQVYLVSLSISVATSPKRTRHLLYGCPGSFSAWNCSPQHNWSSPLPARPFPSADSVLVAVSVGVQSRLSFSSAAYYLSHSRCGGRIGTMYLSTYSNYKSKTTMNPSSIHVQTYGHYFISIRSITTFL